MPAEELLSATIDICARELLSPVIVSEMDLLNMVYFIISIKLYKITYKISSVMKDQIPLIAEGNADV